jgi:hypothetical protein
MHIGGCSVGPALSSGLVSLGGSGLGNLKSMVVPIDFVERFGFLPLSVSAVASGFLDGCSGVLASILIRKEFTIERIDKLQPPPPGLVVPLAPPPALNASGPCHLTSTLFHRATQYQPNINTAQEYSSPARHPPALKMAAINLSVTSTTTSSDRHRR